jgi:hypothetical protein
LSTLFIVVLGWRAQSAAAAVRPQQLDHHPAGVPQALACCMVCMLLEDVVKLWLAYAVSSGDVLAGANCVSCCPSAATGSSSCRCGIVLVTIKEDQQTSRWFHLEARQLCKGDAGGMNGYAAIMKGDAAGMKGYAAGMKGDAGDVKGRCMLPEGTGPRYAVVVVCWQNAGLAWLPVVGCGAGIHQQLQLASRITPNCMHSSPYVCRACLSACCGALPNGQLRMMFGGLQQAKLSF